MLCYLVEVEVWGTGDSIVVMVVDVGVLLPDCTRAVLLLFREVVGVPFDCTYYLYLSYPST